MADETSTGTPEQATDQPAEGAQPQGELIAGKYKDQDAFDSAFDHLADHEKVNMPWIKSATFETNEQKVEAYKGMESRLHSAAPKAESLQLGEDQPAAPSEPMSMEDLVAGVGVQQDAVDKIVMQGGQLPKEIVDKFSQAKITLPDGRTGTLSEDIVKQVFGAQAQAAASAQQSLAAAAQYVGGQDKLNALMQFGGTLDPTTMQSINVELGNTSTMKQGLDRLDAMYQKSIGADQSNPVVSDTQGNVNSIANTPFKDINEKKEFGKKHGTDSEIYKSRLLATPDSAISHVA